MGCSRGARVRTLLWTFSVRGGKPFSIHPERNPEVHHDGRLSIWHLILTMDQVAQIETVAASNGATLRWSAEVQTPEQEEERRELLQAQDESMVIPCIRCPSCFWFDLKVDGYCGFEKWPREQVEEALDTDDKAQADARECPMRAAPS